MKTHKAVSTATAAFSAALLVSGCNTAGSDSGDTGGDSTSGWDDQVATGGGVEDELRSWDPCEVFEKDFYDLVEALNYDEIRGEFTSSKAGIGVPTSHGMCAATVVWAEDPDHAGASDRGLVSISVIPESDAATASERYDELVEQYREYFGEERAESDIDGWDAGILIVGDGIGDTLYTLVRNDSYLIEIGVESGDDLINGGSGNVAPDFTIPEARDYLFDEALPNVQSTITERLETSGVILDE